MPFEFSGTLDKVVIELGKSGLAGGDQQALDAKKQAMSTRD
jgi:hypothetical protein